MNTNFIAQFQNLRGILCICPCCGELVRVSDLHLNFEGKSPKTWVDNYEQKSHTLSLKEQKLEETFDVIHSKSLEMARIEAQRKALTSARSCLDVGCGKILNYDPFDIKAIFYPTDFVVFNGLNEENLKDVTFLSRLMSVDNIGKSLKTSIDSKKYDWKLARVTEKTGIEYE